MSGSLTNVPELDFKILEYLGPHASRSLGETNAYFAQLSQSDYLSRRKVIDEFGLKVAEAKPTHISFYQQYQDLHYIYEINKAVKQGRIDILEAKFRPYDYYNAYDASNDAAKYGQLEVVKWLFNKGLFKTTKSLKKAAAKGHLNILIWLNQRGISPNEDAIYKVIQNNHLHIFKWFIQQGYQPSAEWIEIAVFYNRPTIVELLLDLGINPTDEAITLALEKEHLDILEIFAQHINLTEFIANFPLENISSVTYNWLNQQGYLESSCIIL